MGRAAQACEDALRRTISALDERNFPAARAALLEAWRLTRDPRLAGLCERLDAREPDGLGPTLEDVLRLRAEETLRRFAEVRDVDDPRVTAFALATLEAVPYAEPNNEPVLDACLEVLAERRERRLLDRATTLRAALNDKLRRAPHRDAVLLRLGRVVEAVRAVAAPELPAELVEAIRARLASSPSDAREETVLREAVYAHPDDDTPRLVYGDWLTERGDPRGELIAVQLERRRAGPDAPRTERELELLAKFGRTWAGALAPVLTFGGRTGSTFERGFLSTAVVRLRMGAAFDALWAAPEWSTVERLTGAWPVWILERAPLHALRSLGGIVTQPALDALLRRELSLTDETVRAEATLESFAKLKVAFPGLRTLKIDWPATPTRAELERLASLGLQRLELRREVRAPRGAAEERAFAQLRAELEARPLPIPELALAPPWTTQARPPGLVELGRGSSRSP